MRARRGILLGWLVVAVYAGALVAVAVTTSEGSLPPGARDPDDSSARELIVAWERSRQATFVRFGTFERRSEVTGAVIASEDVLAQRPPRRLHRQLGGVDGRDDDRILTCPAAPPGQAPGACRLGPPGGPTYQESVAEEVAGLESIVLGPTRLYAVARSKEDGCFALDQVRADPRAVFGIEAQLCFDAATGAPANSTVRYEAGIVEVVAVTGIRATVSEADLEP